MPRVQAYHSFQDRTWSTTRKGGQKVNKGQQQRKWSSHLPLWSSKIQKYGPLQVRKSLSPWKGGRSQRGFWNISRNLWDSWLGALDRGSTRAIAGRSESGTTCKTRRHGIFLIRGRVRKKDLQINADLWFKQLSKVKPNFMKANTLKAFKQIQAKLQRSVFQNFANNEWAKEEKTFEGLLYCR